MNPPALPLNVKVPTPKANVHTKTTNEVLKAPVVAAAAAKMEVTKENVFATPSISTKAVSKISLPNAMNNLKKNTKVTPPNVNNTSLTTPTTQKASAASIADSIITSTNTAFDKYKDAVL